MSEQLLSALLDGECTPAEAEMALAAIAQSPELAARWSRMCLTRDALAGVAVARPALDFAAGVMAAIAAEDDAASPSVEHRNVVPLRRPVVAPPALPQRAVARRRRWQPVAGLAAAASIAAVAVVGGRMLLNAPVNGAVALAPTSSGVLLAAAPERVRINIDGEIVAAADQDGAGARWTQLDGAAARQLDGYLLEHSNLRANAGMGGALSYARMVSTADNRSADGSR